MTELNSLGQKLYHDLVQNKLKLGERKIESEKSEKVHIVGVGGVVSVAYEQLRNAVEYAEDHLLLQKAIKRFFRRLFLTQSANFILEKSGDELVTELTFAGYVKNDSVTELMIKNINKLVSEYHGAYIKSQVKSDNYNHSDQWIIDVLSVEVSNIFQDISKKLVFENFAFNYFKESLDLSNKPSISKEDADPILYIAIQKTLLKSNEAIIRSTLIKYYDQSVSNFAGYCKVNAKIDILLESEIMKKVSRQIDRQGAPLRVIYHTMIDNENFSEMLIDKQRFLKVFESRIDLEYESINRRVNRGIIKSIIFLVITKFLIGISIEVPYDNLMHGKIMWLPLMINLLFPLLYMLLLRATLMLPSSANTTKLISQADFMLYKEKSRQISRNNRLKFGFAYNVLYVILFLIVFGGVSWLLVRYLSFEILHLMIFFVFLSGASFLGFRLSRIIREIEFLDSQQNGVTLLRDFLYMPFVVVGRWISEKYSKINIVAVVLDVIIELPLKTILRLLRQWSIFISSKKDQL